MMLSCDPSVSFCLIQINQRVDDFQGKRQAHLERPEELALATPRSRRGLKKAQVDKCWVWKPSPSSSLNDDIVLNDGIDMVENSRLVLGEVMGRPANIRCTFRSAQVSQFASSSSEHAALLPLHFALAAPRTKVSIDYSPRNSKTSQ